MSTMLPSSRLLPFTIVATALALSIKTVAVVTQWPGSAAVSAGTTQALRIAGSASVISEAHAALAAPPAAKPEPTLPRTAPTEDAAPGADARKAAPAAADPARDAVLKPTAVEEQEQRLAEREATLAAAEKAMSSRVGELQAIQERLEALESQRKARDEANWTGLVKVYESMRPREAANIFNSLDKAVLLEILDRMKPAKASPIIALMESESARQVTADLADKRTRDTTFAN